jgi:hypothetical protein
VLTSFRTLSEISPAVAPLIGARSEASFGTPRVYGT